jgi:hypothetical protein
VRVDEGAEIRQLGVGQPFECVRALLQSPLQLLTETTGRVVHEGRSRVRPAGVVRTAALLR